MSATVCWALSSFVLLSAGFALGCIFAGDRRR